MNPDPPDDRAEAMQPPAPLRLLTRPVARYLVAVAAVGLGCLFRVALAEAFGARLPFITFFPAVMLAALLGGLGPGLLATGLSALALAFWILLSTGFAFSNTADAIGLAVFAGVGIFMSVLAGLYHRASAKVGAQERERADQLEKLVAARPEELEAANRELRTEVTERQRAEEALRRREEEAQRMGDLEFRSLAESMPQIVWATRPDGWNIYFNQQWVDYTGMTMEESHGHGWNKPFHPDDQQRAWDAWQRATQHLESYSLECRLRRADGAYRWWLIRGVPMLGANGEILKWFGTCTDIEEIKHTEAALRERTVELETANKELEGFSYSVSHDLRAPLRAVIGYVRMLEKAYGDRLDAEGHRLLGVVASEGQRMGRLIDDLLAFARMSRQHVQCADIDMADLVRAEFESLTRAAPEAAPRLELKPLPPTAGDPAMLRQVFANLLGNAVKFTRLRPDPVIEVGGASHNGETAYYVKDNGVGFDEKYGHKLFCVFQRLHTDAEFEGNGVGLALVQRIVHRHGGHVRAEGKPGVGATFYFTLPNPRKTNP